MQQRLERTATISFLLTVILVASLLAVTIFAPQVTASSYTTEEIEFVQLLNDYRVARGLGPLKVSDALSEASYRHCADMAKYGFFSHYTERSDWFAAGASPWDRMAASGYAYNTYKGENIAAGQRTARAVFEAWKNSSSHHENMINPNYKVVGVSFVYVSGSPYGYYWATDFGGYADPTARTLGSLTAGASTGPGSSSLGLGAPGLGASGSSTGFADVTGTTRYANEITLLAKRGIVSGYGDGRFGPHDRVTRQQFAKMIVLSLGCTVSPVSSCSFRDVSSTPSPSDPLYPAGYIEACVAQGITVGKTPHTFCPYENVTRAQLITMVARAAGLPEPPASYRPAFSNFSAEHYPWARKAAYAGWLDGFAGMGPSFDFWAPATRGEVCFLLASLLK